MLFYLHFTVEMQRIYVMTQGDPLSGVEAAWDPTDSRAWSLNHRALISAHCR